jgi:flagellar M-ring protein FliF
MNQNLKQLGKQLIDIWQQLGLNQRLSVVLAGAAVLVGLGALTFFSTRVSYATLYDALDPADAAKIVQELERDKVAYRTTAGGTSIQVPASHVDRYRMKLAATITSGQIPGWELVTGQSSNMQSDLVQRENVRLAKNGLLARTIMTIDEVESATVHVVEPVNRLIRSPDEHPSASVVVRGKGGRTLSRETVRSIQALVANSVAGLRQSNVSVSDNHGQLLTEEYDENSAIGRAGSRFAMQQQVETHYARQVRSVLDPVLGPGAARVAVHVELDMDTISSTERTLDSANKIPRSLTEKEEVTSTTSGGAGHAAGLASNTTGNTNVTTTAAQNLSNSTVKTTETINDFGEIMRRIEQQAGSIKRMTASVVVNTRYEGTGADRKAVPRTPEELDKLRGIVRTALGIQSDEAGTRKDEITLEEIAFNELPLLAVNQQLQKEHQLNFWLSLAQRLAYPALALFILFVFFRAFRNTQLESIPLGVPIGELDANGQLTGDWNGNGKSRVVTVEVLNQLVKENPRNVTQALRAWMSGSPTKNN